MCAELANTLHSKQDKLKSLDAKVRKLNSSLTSKVRTFCSLFLKGAPQMLLLVFAKLEMPYQGLIEVFHYKYEYIVFCNGERNFKTTLAKFDWLFDFFINFCSQRLQN